MLSLTLHIRHADHSLAYLSRGFKLIGYSLASALLSTSFLNSESHLEVYDLYQVHYITNLTLWKPTGSDAVIMATE